MISEAKSLSSWIGVGFHAHMLRSALEAAEAVGSQLQKWKQYIL